MSDDERPPEDEFPGNVIFFKPTTKTGRPKGSGVQKGSKRGQIQRVTIPVVPTGEGDLSALIVEAKADPSRRGRAAAIMRNRMYSFEEIAEFLGFGNAAAARTAVVNYVLSLDKGNELETLRHALLGALEAQARRSLAMASADAFEDAEGRRYPNTERIAWHKEARQDLEALARISGAQAAAQVKLVTPDSEELDAIVRQLEVAAGRVVEEPDVIVLDVLDEDSDAG